MLHGIRTDELRAQQSVKVDPKLVFKLDPALNIENLGTEEHKSILHAWYTKSVALAIVTRGTNKDDADMNEDRSKEFLTEVQKVTSKMSLIS